MNVIDAEQRSEAWFQAKAGKISASNVYKVFAGKDTATYRNYLSKIDRETRIGRYVHDDDFKSKWMERGNEEEENARTLYGVETNVLVERVGLVIHPTIPRFCCSPDGLILVKKGGIEIKVPTPANHADIIEGGPIDSKWETQIYSQLACMPELDWIDFISFCPDEQEELQLFVKRYYRDEAKIKAIENKVPSFLAEVDIRVARFKMLAEKSRRVA